MLADCVLKLRVLAVSVLAVLAVSATAFATPFSISYTGTIVNSSFPEIINGQPYTVTLVVDNGNATAADQTWSDSDLACVIFRMNAGGKVAYAQDLVATKNLGVSGTLNTNGAGALTSNFDYIVEDAGAPAGSYSFAGFTPQPSIYWYLNEANEVFYAFTHQFGDTSGGVQMAIAYWSNPEPFSGSCFAGAPPVRAPALSAWAEIVLASLLGLGGLAVLRRRSSVTAGRRRDG